LSIFDTVDSFGSNRVIPGLCLAHQEINIIVTTVIMIHKVAFLSFARLTEQGC